MKGSGSVREAKKFARAVAWAVVAAGLMVASAADVSAQARNARTKKETQIALDRGRALLQQNCGRCHAVSTNDASAHHLAPPLRTLGQRYAIDSLEEALAEGLVSGHPDMPEFTFEPDDVGVIIAYLKSIQVKR
jgi:mono/diheme cytochrome c family protein